MPQATPTVSETRVRRSWVILSLLGVMLLLMFVAASSTLWDRDEPRFARAAVEMVRTGDYLVPKFNGVLRPDKPALVYWAMALPVRAWGAAAWAVRLPSVLAMTAVCGLTFWIGRRMFDARVGLAALIMMGTALLPVWVGSSATADGLLNLGTTAALAVMVARVYGGPAWWQPVALALALGEAQLAKGPVGLAVPALAFIAAAVVARRTLGITWRDHLGFWGAALLGAGMFAAWGLPANAATGGQLARLGLGRHVVDRVLNAQEGHGGAGLLGHLAMLPYYLPMIIVGFFPWTLMLPAAVSATLRRHLGGPRERAVVVCWVLPTLVLMSLVSTKLPHYVVPVYPMLAVTSAAVLFARRDRPGQLSEKDRDWLRGGVWFFGPVAMGLCVAMPAAGVVTGDTRWAIGGAVTGGILATMAVWVIRAQLAERVGRSTLGAAAMVIAGALLAGQLVLPGVERQLKPARTLAATVHQHSEDRTDLAAFGYEEPSLVFYLDRPADRRVRMGADLRRWASEPGPGVAVVRADRMDEALADAADAGVGLPLRVLDETSVFNYSARGRKQVLRVVERVQKTPTNLSGTLQKPEGSAGPGGLAKPSRSGGPAEPGIGRVPEK